MTHQSPTFEPADRLRALVIAAEQGKLQSDDELLELFVESGNRQAIGTLIQRYSSMVASVCRCTVADPVSAEDAFQATFLVLLKSAKKIRRRGSVAAWLHGVAYRTASRLRKKRLVNISHESPDEVIALNNTPADPIVTLARQMELEALDQELQKLPTRLRDILVEHYMLGFTAPQIADRMELSVSAVEGRIRRGRHALRRVLARRGISLSVLVAATTWFQQHLHATEAAAWTTTFLDAHLPEAALSPDYSVSSDISSLVSGELSMFGTTSTKSLVAAGFVLLIGGVISFRAIGTEGGEAGDGASGTTNVLNMKSLPVASPPVVAQIDGAFSIVGAPVAAVANTEVDRKKRPRKQEAAPAEKAASTPAPAKPEPVTWAASDADPPAWLDYAKNSRAQEKIRARLSETTDIDFADVPLVDVVALLKESLGVDIYLDRAELENAGLDVDDLRLTLRAEGPITEILRRLIMQIDDAELGYIVRDSGIEITTSEAVDGDPQTRYYDLSYVLPNSENAEPLMNAISSQIQSDRWSQGGGTWTMSLVGSMLIASCSEPAHQRIETMLSRLAAMNRANLEKHVVPSTGFGMGGYGGGMGGMGGGGMGGGGMSGGGMGGGGMF